MSLADMRYSWPKYRNVSLMVKSGKSANSCGMYPTPGPGTGECGEPGSNPKTRTTPD
mgnify:CR=1 FL=1